MKLSATKEIEIRFSEVDSMNVVWHGSYALYFEDAREAFGAKYGLGYGDYISNEHYAPIVELTFHYKKSIRYGMHPVIEITYVPTAAAKIVFDYEMRDSEDGTILATGHSVQVFMDMDYRLVYDNPDFYLAWKKKWGLLE